MAGKGNLERVFWALLAAHGDMVHDPERWRKDEAAKQRYRSCESTILEAVRALDYLAIPAGIRGMLARVQEQRLEAVAVPVKQEGDRECSDQRQ